MKSGASLCARCNESPTVPAYVFIGELVVRRLSFCSECVVEELAFRRRDLPLEMLGMWPIDFDVLREGLHEWLRERSDEDVRGAGESVARVMQFFRQEWPPGFEAERSLLHVSEK
jgi:hypothetical protein